MKHFIFIDYIVRLGHSKIADAEDISLERGGVLVVSFQLAIFAPRETLIGYEIATAQSYQSSAIPGLFIVPRTMESKRKGDYEKID